VAPSSTDGPDTVRKLVAAAAPEEEIFGLVYDGQQRITGGDFTVTLEEVGSGACIHEFTSGTPTCLDSQTMTVNPAGIRPNGATVNMWGWYNDLDTDGNPCRAAEVNHDEVHDEDGDGQADGGVEKHCVTLGTYRVTLEQGLTTWTRTIDHLPVSGEEVAGKQVEDPTVASPGDGNFFDTIVHFDVGTATYPLQNLNAIGIDNPETSEAFAPGDTVVPVDVPVRIDSDVTTPMWDQTTEKGRLLARTFFDSDQNPSDRNNHWDPHGVIRTHPYTSADTFQVRVEATTPEKPTDVGTTSSSARTVIVQPATGDQAAPAGHTFPSSMTAGGIASVTLTMTNSGTTTWSGGYHLGLYEDTVAWFPLSDFPSSPVPPDSAVTFAFDLRHIEPELTGLVPAFYRMSHEGFFGMENGQHIFVSGSKSLSALGGGPEVGTSPLSPETTGSWTAGAEDGGTSPLPLPRAALEAGGVVLEYTYHHAVPRDLDVVLAFTYDPDLVEPLPPRLGPGASRLAVRAGPGEEGEYWVRLTGTVPAGEGRIVDLPFRRVEGAVVPAEGAPGTLTLFYPK